tara:strand:+ start:47060 stop:47800 length:741 start_codon:yes stop_codon:yes gene_type:complete
MIIAISGKKNSGKDTVAKMIQLIVDEEVGRVSFPKHSTLENKFAVYEPHAITMYQTKRFADKLKDMVCMLLGCTREKLEDREFKEKELGEEWWYYYTHTYGDIPQNLQAYANFRPSQSGSKYTLKKQTPRLLMQLLGTECGRQILHPDVWVNGLLAEYEASVSNGTYPKWIIPDMRFPNEAEALRYRSITIRVNRPDVYLGLVKEHESETALDNWDNWDYVLENNGTLEDLYKKVDSILVETLIIG